MRSLIFFPSLSSLIILCLAGATLLAQAPYRAGILPRVNVSTTLSPRWKLNTAVESRQQLVNSRNEDTFGYQYLLTDAIQFASFQTTAHQQAGIGYTLRLASETTIHRLSLLYTFNHKGRNYRLGHRIVWDGTFSHGQPPVWRLRYRHSWEFPLNGDAVDPGEFYFKASNEYLGIFEAGTTDMEWRLLPFLGFEINDNHKIETGPDYRLDGILQSAPRHTCWWGIVWFVAL
ncbi:MAG: DUF2490 domain-containing protein [Saprospiraceae bacterium]